MGTLLAKDIEMLKMRMDGKSYMEIAKAMGYKDHSAVVKRMRHLGSDFEEHTGIHCGFADEDQMGKSSYNKSI